MPDIERIFPNTPIVKVSRTTWDVYGDPGTWKSGFAASFPAPIIVINFDKPWDYIRSLYPDKYISVMDIGVIGDMDEFTAVTAYNQVKQYIDTALTLDGGTLVIDGGTQFWTLLKMVILAPIARERQARGKDLQPFDNAKANAEFTNMAGKLSRSKLNVVFTHWAGDVWDTDDSGRNPHPTGRQYAKESDAMEYAAEIQLYHYLAAASDGSGDKVPWSMITKCSFREAVIGMKFEKPVYEKLAPWVLPL